MASRSFALVHHRPASLSSAFSKKSGPPKLPDFSASASGAGPFETSTGTPGSISGPMVSAPRPSAETTAPEVSPPATTSRRVPPATRLFARLGEEAVERARRPARGRGAAAAAATASGAADE